MAGRTTPRRYAVVGAGAVGGLYGMRLDEAGHDVRYLLRSDLDHARRHGLRLESPDGDLHLPSPRVHGHPDEIGPVDVVLVGLKATSNHHLADLLPPLVRPGTAVVLLQNGLGVEERVAALVPDAHVLAGLCFVCSLKPGPGHVRHVDYGAVLLAEWAPGGEPAGTTSAVRALADDLAATPLPVRTHPDLLAARWRKLVWNIPYNGLSVVLDAGTDELNAHPASRALVQALMEEVAAAAAASGHPAGEGVVARMLGDTDTMVPYRTSMKTDYDTGAPLELDAIYAAPLAAAAAAGCPMPGVAALHRQLRFLEARRDGAVGA